MDLSTVRILLDLGLVVLIWMVQILIYPSFMYFEKESLIEWHKKYARGMFFVVMPLMLGQLTVCSVQLYQGTTIFSMTYFGFVLVLWLVTFIWFVPLHRKIADNKLNPNTLHKLVSRNWLRTCLWTLLFVTSLFHFLYY